jgi:ribosomal protein S18 acetylase RimI-like enzyme
MEAETLTVRAARAEDVPPIARIHVDAWRAAYRGHMPDQHLDSLNVDERARMWSRALARPAPARLIVTGALTGFCFYGPSRDDDQAEIYALYVDPRHWRQGAGRALCAHAEGDARGRECSSVALWTLESNQSARRFYERIGYAADGARRTNPRPTGFPLQEMRYRKALG